MNNTPDQDVPFALLPTSPQTEMDMEEYWEMQGYSEEAPIAQPDTLTTPLPIEWDKEE